jgi:predicted dehydrogenase
VEDCANMSLRFASGCSAQIAFALLREPAPLTCRLTVLGTAGMVVVDTWKGYEIHTGRRNEVRDIYGNTPHSEKVLAGMRAEIDEFLQSIQERREPCPSATESTRALAIVCEFYEAAKTRQTQSVNI